MRLPAENKFTLGLQKMQEAVKAKVDRVNACFTADALAFRNSGK